MKFIKHKPGKDGWSEWVQPCPKSYFMKCCDCGLIHEFQFRVLKYARNRTKVQFRARRTK